MLALWGAASGDDFDAAVALNVLFSAASLALLFLCLRQVANARVAALSVMVLAVNPELVRFTGAIRSEPLYIFLSLLSLWFLLRAQGRARWLAAALAVALLAALTRSIGATLVGAIALHWLMERRWKLVGVPALLAVLAIGIWIAWTALDPEQYAGSSYVAELRMLWRGESWTGPLPQRAFRWAGYYITIAIPHQLALPTVSGTRIDNALGVLLAGVCIVTGLVVFFRRWRPAALYVLIYVALLVVWLYAVDRFALPLVPLLVAALITGASWLSDRVAARFGGAHASGKARARWAGAVPIAIALVLTVTGAAHTQALVRERVRCERNADYPDVACISADQASYFEALRWIEAQLPEDAVLLAAKYAPLWLYTGRRVISYEQSIRQDETSFLRYVRERGAGWILLGSLHNREPAVLGLLVEANCAALRLEAFFPPRTYLFRIAGGSDDAPTAPGPDDACAAAAAYVAASEGRSFGTGR
jgi:hypothetical protein